MRAFAALAVTSLAAVTLLLGPDATLGIDLPTSGGTGSVTQVTQQVTSTVQQTAQPVVTTVQTTTQQVATQVEQTAAPVAAAPTAPAAAAPTPVQHTAAPVRASTPTKKLSTVAHAVVRSSKTAGTAVAVTRSAGAVATRIRAVSRSAGRPRVRASHSSPSRKPAHAADGGCASSALLGTLGSLLGSMSNSALGALLCNAANLLAAGPQPSLTANGSAAGPRLGGVLAVIASSVPARLRVLAYANSAAKNPFALGGTSGRGDELAKTTAASVGATGARGGSTGAFGSAPSVAQLQAGHGSKPAATGGHHGGGLFGSSVTGTEAIFALLVADWALLVAVAMWKLARRRRRRLAFGF